MLRIISEIHPTWIIGENVSEIINMGLDQVLSDLENEGYTCQPFIIPACAVNAPHRRDRIWIIAYTNSFRFPQSARFSPQQHINFLGENFWARELSDGKFITNKYGCPQYNFKSILCGNDDGIPSRVDRLKSLGNAIVPQCVVPIMQAIKELQSNVTNH
jgi:DNA (cytosine-5)-methyltransferase 1